MSLRGGRSRETGADGKGKDGENLAVKVAILGTGNIGTDLLIKIQRKSRLLQAALFAGVDPASDRMPVRFAPASSPAGRLSFAATLSGKRRKP